MLAQLNTLDYSILHSIDEDSSRGIFSPLHATTVSEIATNTNHYTDLGLQAIRAGKVGSVLLAGGQGSRLGFDHPKGMFNVGVNRELYIFECLINNLLAVTRQADAWVPLFIMTSVDNHDETKAFFEEHDYFGYSKDNVWFFQQE